VIEVPFIFFCVPVKVLCLRPSQEANVRIIVRRDRMWYNVCAEPPTTGPVRYVLAPPS
jgi:hypothetical protein